jgi:hypothetical protein
LEIKDFPEYCLSRWNIQIPASMSQQINEDEYFFPQGIVGDKKYNDAEYYDEFTEPSLFIDSRHQVYYHEKLALFAACRSGNVESSLSLMACFLKKRTPFEKIDYSVANVLSACLESKTPAVFNAMLQLFQRELFDFCETMHYTPNMLKVSIPSSNVPPAITIRYVRLQYYIALHLNEGLAAEFVPVDKFVLQDTLDDLPSSTFLKEEVQNYHIISCRECSTNIIMEDEADFRVIICSTATALTKAYLDTKHPAIATILCKLSNSHPFPCPETVESYHALKDIKNMNSSHQSYFYWHSWCNMPVNKHAADLFDAFLDPDYPMTTSHHFHEPDVISCAMMNPFISLQTFKTLFWDRYQSDILEMLDRFTEIVIKCFNVECDDRTYITTTGNVLQNYFETSIIPKLSLFLNTFRRRDVQHWRSYWNFEVPTTDFGFATLNAFLDLNIDIPVPYMPFKKSETKL